MFFIHVFIFYRSELPYLESTIQEVIRITTPIPISLPQETISDTTLFGYKIPAGTKYMVNFTKAHRDPNVWVDPDKFDPARFMTKDGKCNYKHPGWMGYGVGWYGFYLIWEGWIRFGRESNVKKAGLTACSEGE